MKCQFCSSPATVHLTELINQKKREMHLCEACARQHQILPELKQELNIPALLQFLIGQPIATGGKLDLAALACAACGMKYAQFRAQGRLGCPHDYDAFRIALEPLLERIHRKTRHAGKVPVHMRDATRAAELADLRAQLRAAVEAERFEDAARLRDLLRQKEAPG